MEYRKRCKSLGPQSRKEIILDLDEDSNEVSDNPAKTQHVSTTKRMKNATENASSTGKNPRKRTANQHQLLLDQKLIEWFFQTTKAGLMVTNSMLQTRALLLNKELCGRAEFSASIRWIQRFKARHKLISPPENRPKLDCVLPEDPFPALLVDFLKHNDGSNAYTVRASSLFWKSLPLENLEKKRRVSVMLCANMSGTHKLPLYIVGRLTKPQCFQNIRAFPVLYAAQEKAYMDQNLFLDWYVKLFLPQVQERQNRTNKRGKVLLLLDSAPIYPEMKQLCEMSNICKVIQIPNNVSLVPPMEDGIVQKVMKLYKKNMISELLIKDGFKVEEFLRNYTLKDCCYKLAAAWGNVRSNDLRKSWNKILEWNESNETLAQSNQSEEAAIHELVHKFQGFYDCKSPEFERWLHETFPGWEEEEDPLAKTITSSQVECEFETHDEISSLKKEPSDEIEIIEIKKEIDPPASVSPQDAISALKTAMNWCETRSEFDDYSLLMLNKIRELTLEIINSQKPKTGTCFRDA